MISPVFDEYSNMAEFSNIDFAVADVDEISDVATNNRMRAMPTFNVYYKGERIDQQVGASRDKLLDLLKKHAAIKTE